MKIVIQCAASKDPTASSFCAADGRRISFVAQPGLAPRDEALLYARPDDLSVDARTWRTYLLEYNARGDNPLNLLPAWRLYKPPTYRDLVNRFGESQVYILSAGWGLIPSGYLTPDYDITFNSSADAWKRRRRQDRFNDFCLMPDDGESICFVGGADYLPLFCQLTATLIGRKTVFFNRIRQPDLPIGFTSIRYQTATRMNWHYVCAQSLIAGRAEVGQQSPLAAEATVR